MKYKTTLLAAVAMIATAPAYAQTDWNPYVGFDIQHHVPSYETEDLGGGAFVDYGNILADGLTGFNIHVGVRPHENFGVEFGAFRTREEGESIALGQTIGPGTVAGAAFTTDLQLQGVTLDGLGYLPLNKTFSAIGTAGISYTNAEANIVIPAVANDSFDESEFGFRVGAGAQAQITDNVSVRALARYQTADFENTVDGLWSYSAGLNFGF